MDEVAFSQELSSLKQRLLEMNSSKLKSSARAQSRLNEVFNEQLNDVKAHLTSIQTSIDAHTSARIHDDPSVSHAGETLRPFYYSHDQSMLPPAPLFWQMFTSLRSDVRGLDERVALVEENVSELGDRVDALDPPHFTPLSSENSCSEVSTGSGPFADNFRPACRDWAMTHPFRTYGSEPGYQSSPSGHSLPPIGELANSEAAPARIDRDAFTHMMQLPQSSQHTNHAASEGVAFRDREIIRLEELVRAAHEKLKISEDLVTSKDGELAQLKWTNDRLVTSLAKLQLSKDQQNHIMESYSSVLAEKEVENARLSHDNHQNVAALHALSSKVRIVQQTLTQREAKLSFATEALREMKIYREILQVREDIDKEAHIAICTKDEEISRLREFCEQKDAIISQQEVVMERGARILEDRDNEMTQLCRDLKVLRDDCHDAVRERDRYHRLLSERDQDRGQWTCPSSQAGKEHDREGKRHRHSHAQSSRRCDMMRDLSASPAREDPMQNYRGARIVNYYEESPHGQERPSRLHQSGPSYERADFQIDSQRSRAFSPGSSRERFPASPHAIRRINSVRLLEKLARADRGDQQSADHTVAPVRRISPFVQRRRPDNVAAQPSLPPAPDAPRRVETWADLRSISLCDAARSGAQRQLSKHQSLQDLPRRKLQAYVEDESMGGDV